MLTFSLLVLPALGIPAISCKTLTLRGNIDGHLRFLLFSLSNKAEINLLFAYLFLHFVQTLGRRAAVKTSYW